VPPEFRLVPATSEHTEALLQLQGAAVKAYDDFVYVDSQIADEAHRVLVLANAGEFLQPYASVALSADDVVVGMIARLTGRELRSARMRATRALQKAGFFARWPEVAKRMSAASVAMAKVDASDYYLSRIAVSPATQGRGLGSLLMEEYFRSGKLENAERALLEVSADNDRALRLYARLGFEEIGRSEASSDGRVLCYAHLARSL